MRMEFGKARGRVSSSVLGALYWPVEERLKNQPRRRTIYKLNGSGGGGSVEFRILSHCFFWQL